MGELKREFFWSFSRADRLERCARKYYYQHYGAWGGWSRSATPVQRELYRLTKLESRATWQGSIVHRVIARALDGARAGVPAPDVDAVVDEVLGWMRQDFADSRDDVARRTGDVKAHVRFVEHERPHDPASPHWRQQWKSAAEFVERCIRAFFASEDWRHLSRLPPEDWLEIEDWSGRLGPTAFTVEGVKVFGKIDCAFREGDRVVVVDWKTGRDADGAPRQLATYALALAACHGADPDRIVAREVNVATGTRREHDVTAAAREAFLVHFRSSVASMRALLVDVGADEPRPESEFAFAEDPGECRWCRFRSVCPRTAAAM